MIDAESALHRTAGLLRCFLVEDSQLIRTNLIATLEEMLPLKVIGCAEDVAGALRWRSAADVGCDLMIIDIFLKSGTGIEVLRQASELCPSAKRIVLTNYAAPEIRRRCEQLGADRVFDKSAELEELLSYCEQLSLRAPG